MSSVVKGKDCVFQVNITGDWKSVICAKSFSLVTTTEEIETTTLSDGSDPEEGLWKDFDYHSLSYNITLEGILKMLDTLNDTFWEVLAAQTGFLEVPFRVIYKDPELNTNSLVGVVMVKTSSLNASASGFVNTNIEFLGKGKYAVATLTELHQIVFKEIISGTPVNFNSSNQLTGVTDVTIVNAYTIQYDYPTEELHQFSISFRLARNSAVFTTDWAPTFFNGLISTSITATDMTTYWFVEITFTVIEPHVTKTYQTNKTF